MHCNKDKSLNSPIKKRAFINLSFIIIILVITFLALVVINAKKAIFEAQRVSIGWSSERGELENCRAINIKTKAKKSYQKHFKEEEFCSVILKYNGKKVNKSGQTEYDIFFWVDVAADILVIGGGGGGGSSAADVQNGGAGGGGAGGFLYKTKIEFENNIKYKVAIGGGGSRGDEASSYRGYNGKNSQFGDVIALGGGGGGASSRDQFLNSGLSGGSGGGAGNWGGNPGFAIGDQGNQGGNVSDILGSGSGAGGGGAGEYGQIRSSWKFPGAGGIGVENDITGPKVTYAVGGRGGWYYEVNQKSLSVENGFGNGGIGGSANGLGSNGGSGIIIINYRLKK